MPEEIPSNENDGEFPSIKKGKKLRRKKQAHGNGLEQSDEADPVEAAEMQKSLPDPIPSVNQAVKSPAVQIPASDALSEKGISAENDQETNGHASHPNQRTDSSVSGSESGEKAGMEKILRGIFVEPMVAVGTVAKDAGETALKPVKQVQYPASHRFLALEFAPTPLAILPPALAHPARRDAQSLIATACCT